MRVAARGATAADRSKTGSSFICGKGMGPHTHEVSHHWNTSGALQTGARVLFAPQLFVVAALCLAPSTS